MKFLFILLSLFSINTTLAECSAYMDGRSSSAGILSELDQILVENLEGKGLSFVSRLEEAKYTLSYKADWYSGGPEAKIRNQDAELGNTNELYKDNPAPIFGSTGKVTLKKLLKEININGSI